MLRTTSRNTFGRCYQPPYKWHCWKPVLCRVPAALGKARNTLGKGFAEYRKSTRQIFTLGKIKMRKKPKNNSKNFIFGEGRHRPAPVRPAPPAIKVAVIFEQISRLLRPAGFELTTSSSCVCCSTTALHCHLCLDSIIYPHILY